MFISAIRRLTPDTLASERDRLPLWIPVCLGLGIGGYFALYDEPPLWAGALGMMVALGLAYVVRRHFLARLVCLALAVAGLGMAVASLKTALVATPVMYGELFFREVSGRIDDMQQKENGLRLVLSEPFISDFPEKRTPKRITVTLKKWEDALQIGDRVTLNAMLFSPPAPVMPGAYDFTRSFYFDGIGAVGFSPQLPLKVEHAELTKFAEKLTAARLAIAQRIETAMSKEGAPIAAAMMVGEMSGISQEVADAMRDAGIYHVLSISGLHMSLAVGLVYFSLRFLFALWPRAALRLPVKKAAAGLGLLAAFIYLLLAGYPVPAVRSFVMVACVMAAVMLDRRGISLYSLAWAAVIILLTQPEALLGVSFQLSFAATMAILALYEQFGARLTSSQGRLPYKLWLYFVGLMATSLAATLATTPLVIYQFNRFTLWGILANMLMVPLASFWIMPACVLAFLAMPFGLEHWPLAWLDIGIHWMVDGARWIASLPHAAFFLPSPPFWGLMMTVAGGLWLCLWHKRWRLLGVPFIALGIASGALHVPYDMLISDDGTKAAVRLPQGQYVFLRGRPNSFDGDAWLRSNGQEDAFTAAQKKDVVECSDAVCVIESHGKRIAVGQGKKYRDQICEVKADIVVADAFLDKECGHISLVIDKAFLRQSGAVGLRFGETTKMEKANDYRGNRPWVPRFPERKARNTSEE